MGKRKIVYQQGRCLLRPYTEIMAMNGSPTILMRHKVLTRFLSDTYSVLRRLIFAVKINVTRILFDVMTVSCMKLHSSIFITYYIIQVLQPRLYFCVETLRRRKGAILHQRGTSFFCCLKSLEKHVPYPTFFNRMLYK